MNQNTALLGYEMRLDPKGELGLTIDDAIAPYTHVGIMKWLEGEEGVVVIMNDEDYAKLRDAFPTATFHLIPIGDIFSQPKGKEMRNTNEEALRSGEWGLGMPEAKDRERSVVDMLSRMSGDDPVGQEAMLAEEVEAERRRSLSQERVGIYGSSNPLD